MSSTRSGCWEPCPIWSWMFPGIWHLQTLFLLLFSIIWYFLLLVFILFLLFQSVRQSSFSGNDITILFTVDSVFLFWGTTILGYALNSYASLNTILSQKLLLTSQTISLPLHDNFPSTSLFSTIFSSVYFHVGCIGSTVFYLSNYVRDCSMSYLW